MSLLDNAPVATVITVLAAVIGGVIAILNPEVLSYEDYLKNLGILIGGAGVLGIARAQSGKGIK